MECGTGVLKFMNSGFGRLSNVAWHSDHAKLWPEIASKFTLEVCKRCWLIILPGEVL
jgi:hypothetical protein